MRSRIIAAFAAVYLIWGSTYLAIRFAIETIPPFLMAGVRFLVAGGILFAIARASGAPRPRAVHWKGAAAVGALLLLGGNGAVVWAEQTVPSGVAALLVAIVPCWLVLIEWLRPGGARPTLPVVLGLMLGMAGLVLLVGPESLIGGGRIEPIGAAVLALGSLSWAAGSILSRHVALPERPRLATAMQMLAGGALLIGASLIATEPAGFEPAAVSLKSLLALLYLIVFGAIIGYTAYIWLLRATTPAKVGTYAYVNPVVAVLLGWALADEALTARMIIAAVVIVGGVALITMGRSPRTKQPAGTPGECVQPARPEAA